MLIDELEYLLSLLPSLVYLDLGRRLDSSLAFLQRFCQWEQFIPQKLRQLEHFYFEFFSSKRNYEDIQNIESIIAAFRTPFWSEQKRWFVTCEYVYQGRVVPQTILFLLSKTSTNDPPDQFAGSGISYSTSTTKIGDTSKMNSVWTVRIDLAWMIKAISTGEVCIPIHLIIFEISNNNWYWYVD
ncbi:unnamed protein product [Rotaria sp. Silwood2]|nr:unnamed protein product [Rotaria sp. Silwood2]CAF4398079.1 unnamed protein product [Rotaria sp. Silwood2]